MAGIAHVCFKIAAGHGRAEWETSLRLVAFGMRRGKLFLDLSRGHPKPFFGLSNPRIILPMLVDAEERIRVLRSVASNLDLDCRFTHYSVQENGQYYW